ncbi:5219_t:CDS:2, partial [Ambispora leptoticha]
ICSEKWGNILYNIKKEGGTAGKITSARKTISEIVKPLGDQVKRIHIDGFIVAGRPPYPEIPNLLIFEENEFHSTDNLSDFEKKQKDKEQDTKLIVKRFDINLSTKLY